MLAGGKGWWFDNKTIDITCDVACYIISGELHFAQLYNDRLIEDCFSIKIEFPYDYPLKLPRVFETKNRIPKHADWHNSDTSGLCLATPAEIRCRIQNIPQTVNAFLSNFLIPYLFANSFKEKTGEYPWVTSGHGIDGIIEEYKIFFDIHDNEKIVNFLTKLFEKKSCPKGHELCPCNNGKKFRDCHMGKVFERIKYYPYICMKQDYDALVQNERKRFDGDMEIKRIISSIIH